MFKYINLLLMFSISFSTGTFLPNIHIKSINTPPVRIEAELWEKWGLHIIDFLELVDIEEVLSVVLDNLADPEVFNFIGFIISPKFKELILDFESMAEFKEAFEFLKAKGYDVDFLINIVNSELDLPPFGKPMVAYRDTKGMTGFIEAMIDVLSLEEMKKLFESKLETSPEIAELFETINSKEFTEILRRMAKNPKFIESKVILESYGFDFKYLCSLAEGFFGDYYQGIFCE